MVLKCVAFIRVVRHTLGVTMDDRTPVIVGVGQVTVRVGEPVLEPPALLAEAVRRAEADSGGRGLIAAASSVRVAKVLGPYYRNEAALVAACLGMGPVEAAISTEGGNAVGALVAETAASILAGEIDVALLCGGEAWRTFSAAHRDGTELDWMTEDEGAAPDRVIGPPFDTTHPAEEALGIHTPMDFYPLFEDAWRAHLGRTPGEHAVELGRLYSRFSDIAAANPYAWDRTGYCPDEIVVPSKTNRMVSTPYTKLLCSNEMVDQGAALILCSASAARAAGVPIDRWVFPLAATEAEAPLVSERYDLWSSPMIRAAGRVLREVTSLGPDDIAYVDIYSCFPSAVQVQASELGFGLDRDVTVTGGMRFAGGPWMNYPMHAVATMVELLRADPGAAGLWTANGGVLSKQVTSMLSSAPPPTPFRTVSAQAEADANPTRTVDASPAGTGVVEAATIQYDRNGPSRGIVAALMPDGRRGWGIAADVAELVGEDLVGRAVDLHDGAAVIV